MCDVSEGGEMDRNVAAYAKFADLYRYCYRVASAVGLACIHIWGFSDERAKEYAEKAGIAFQLTNILRDLGEDVARGRVYLPREDLVRFGYSEEELRQGARDGRLAELMRFEVAPANGYYEAALPLADLLRPPGRSCSL